MPRALIVQRRMTHYRVALFELMRARLEREGVELVVLSGDPTAAEASKKDGGELGWSRHLRTRYWLDGRLCWQPFGSFLHPGDLVVVTQENRLLYNHWLVLRPGRDFKLAFWGHGRNFQSSAPAGLRERFKAWTARRVDWWFAYTSLSRQAICAAGFPAQRVTLLNNSIDTRVLRRERDAVTPGSTAALRAQLRLQGCKVAAFIGALTEEKRLDFLVQACSEVHARMPNFRLLVIGDGPRRAFVEDAARHHPWLVWTGALAGERKACHLALAELMLMPGAVGLAILDAFVFGLPLLTTDCGNHGPEIAYLQDGHNGLMLGDAPPDYAQALHGLLQDPQRVRALSEGARASADTFSLEAMAENFSRGVLVALGRASAGSG